MTRRTLKRVVFDLVQLMKLRRAGEPFPPVADPGTNRTEPGAGSRFFIGPANSAGQGCAWARALEAGRGTVRATSMAFTKPEGFEFAVDQAVPAAYAAYSRRWQSRQLAAVSQFDAAVIESGRPPFAGLLGGDVRAQFRALERAGVRTALLFHGSDIRDPDRHLSLEPNSHYQDPEFAETFREVSRRNRALCADLNTTVFASTPDLYDELVESVADVRWLPVVIDPSRWANAEAPFAHDGPLRVLHLPSKSAVKGTQLIEPVLREAERAGTIDFREPSGVPHREMPRVLHDVDVVLDQFRVGGYGVAACEALAAGKLVVSHVNERARERVRRDTGEDLPIIEATPETLRDVLHDIRARPEYYAEKAALGPAFVARHHDGRRSAETLDRWMNMTEPMKEAVR